jgi:hypothetical protein
MRQFCEQEIYERGKEVRFLEQEEWWFAAVVET